ncbi:alcohol dehydrogenase catalytic domain-containing protein [Nocardioides sp. dk4132]|uniref:NAD(P)-dependent alcohol dehydrogenase n=1 Tax=unclassified Nocardioides TaxID=2615069 RepID=UPI001294F27C|nr:MULTISPECIES: NAD(P)-dependent alcohol dehydrogenase [unclassified Nocardioides]MQW78016.1 alcohol dehydrogenase catalytic domain-containing protein [Nocardioides sp. dk4132]QGA08123.1 alcohol dehydrogenase catalytic domain-containing protein [Nocardioides sp. dk884]
MRALQHIAPGQPPEVREVPTPSPTGGQVLIKVVAAGACHSDEFVMSLPTEGPGALGIELPLTLGHEGVGVVAELGPAASGVEVGEAVAVYGPWGCGRCRTCTTGAEQYCERAGELGIRPPGLGAPGAMAEYLLVDDARHLVPLQGLDPVAAAPLTDAGLTPYHAIKPVLPALTPGTTAVVIGAGGLGHLAIQMLKALSACRIIALDLGEDKLAFAQEVGADHAFTSDDTAIEAVREVTGGRMADAVFDFVGMQASTSLAAQMVHAQSEIVVVGVGDGAVPVGFLTLPYNVRVRSPYWGTIPELHEVLALARSGAIRVETEVFSLDDASTIYERMHARQLRGRAVVVL